jgi:hypothetical protein
MGYSAVEESWAPSYDSSPLFKIEGPSPCTPWEAKGMLLGYVSSGMVLHLPCTLRCDEVC